MYLDTADTFIGCVNVISHFLIDIRMENSSGDLA